MGRERGKVKFVGGAAVAEGSPGAGGVEAAGRRAAVTGSGQAAPRSIPLQERSASSVGLFTSPLLIVVVCFAKPLIYVYLRMVRQPYSDSLFRNKHKLLHACTSFSCKYNSIL